MSSYKILYVVLSIFIVISCTNEGRDEAVNFLNKHIKKWTLKQDKLLKKYNDVVSKSDFQASEIIKIINKELTPEFADLRNEIKTYNSKISNISNLKQAFMNKIDYLMQGLSKIEHGLKTNDEKLLNQGRQELKNYKEQKEKYNRQLKDFLKKYNIEIKGEKYVRK